jgi:hypothetical protein
MRIAATMTLAALLGCGLMATSVASAADTNAHAATTFVKDCRAGKMH